MFCNIITIGLIHCLKEPHTPIMSTVYSTKVTCPVFGHFGLFDAKSLLLAKPFRCTKIFSYFLLF